MDTEKLPDTFALYMIILIPIAIWLSTAICYMAVFRDAGQPFRRSLLAASIAIFFFIGAITEVLGALNLINDRAIIASWFTLDFALLLGYLNVKKRYGGDIWQVEKSLLASLKVSFKQLGILTIVILVVLSLITLVVAIVATPNNADSLSYHLSRLGYWIQNGNVSHYATNIERSISFSPFSEYVHLHTFLLTGTERYFQLVQWLCLVGILAIISLLVQLFSDSKRVMQISLTFAATLPIAVLESMTTQNDLIVAFFILATAFFVFDYTKKQCPITLVLLALVVGLGMMTKGTFAFYVFPFGAFLFVFMVSKTLLKPLFRTAIGSIVILLLLNGPFWYRTYQIFQTPIGRISSGNETHFKNAGGFLSSVSKHVFLHLGFVSPGNRYNTFVEQQLQSFHTLIDTPLNVHDNGMEFKMNKLNFNEDFAHNFLAIWLVIFSIPLLFFVKLSRFAKLYAGLSLLSFLTFCFFIAYQTYGSRLHIAFFMLYSPIIGLVYGSVLSGIFSKALVMVLWLAALPFALLSASHPLLSTKWFFEKVFPPINSTLNLNIHIAENLHLKQESILFLNPEKSLWGDHLPEMENLVQEINLHNAQKIGFDFEEYSYDYAYQYLLRKPGRVFEHIAVRNPSAILEKQEFQPDAIIAEHYEGEKFSYHNRVYFAKAISPGKWLYIPHQ